MKKSTSAILATLLMTTFAAAGPVDDTIVLNEDTKIVTRAAAPGYLSDVMDEVMSGWLFRGTETRAMQADDFDNPGMIFVEQAQEAWDYDSGPAINMEAGQRAVLHADRPA